MTTPTRPFSGLRAVAIAGMFGVIAIAVASCIGPTTRDGKPISPSECVRQGGVRDGIQGQACIMPAADAGKACSKASDCIGACQADTRTCSAKDGTFGCYEYLDETGQVVGICAD